MKYEVSKAYIHDGSAECPLPEGSRASILLACGSTWEDRDSDIWDWSETGTSDSIVAFVPTFIPPQTIERWAVITKDGGVLCVTEKKESADDIASRVLGRRVILMREVTE